MILVILLSGFIILGNQSKLFKNSTAKNLANLKKMVTQEKNDFFVSSFIVPHHLVAEDLIEEIFAKVAQENRDKKIKRIILISPNHFNAGDGWINVADKKWSIDNDSVVADGVFIKKLKESKLARVDNNAFEREHGVEAQIPFIKKYFPNVPIVPISIKDGFPLKKVEELADFLSKNSSDNSLMILSADFSHYLDKNISDLHDKKAISEIQSFNYENIYNLDMDCVAGLYLLMKFAQAKNCDNFHLVNNSNSSETYKNDFIGENTSYVTGYFSQQKIVAQYELRANVLFVGDLMLDRYNRKIIENYGVGYFTKDFNRLLWSQDLNVLNLEGPVTDNQSVSLDTAIENPAHFKFTFDKESTKNFLTGNRINVVNLGNNHILNFGVGGAQETVNFLKETKVDYFGSPLDEKNTYIEKEISGLKIALVSYNRFYKLGSESVVNKIKEAKSKNDLVIVYAHWGNEYELVQSESQKNIAHSFIDSGADLIIGSHPHVVQPIEIYKNKAIFYSLGNFVFDQYFSEDVKNELVILSSFSDKKVELILVPLFRGADGGLIFKDKDRHFQFLGEIADKSEVPESFKKQIKMGKIVINR